MAKKKKSEPRCKKAATRKKATAKKSSPKTKAAKKKTASGQAKTKTTDSFGFLANIAAATVGPRSSEAGNPEALLEEALMDLGLDHLARRLETIETPADLAEFVGATLHEILEHPDIFSEADDASCEEAVDELVDLLISDELYEFGPAVPDILDGLATRFSPTERIEAANAAMELDPNRLEPYIVLADALERDDAEARSEIADMGLRVGRRRMRKVPSRRRVPDDSDLDPLRMCYVWLLCESADALNIQGRLDEAIERWEEALPLDVREEENIREPYGEALLLANRDREALAVLAPYEDNGFNTPYNLSLLHYRLEGDSPKARKTLDDAIQGNSSTAAWLLNPENAKQYAPADTEYYVCGSTAEAYHYVEAFRSAWSGTPGALEWLRRRWEK